MTIACRRPFVGVSLKMYLTATQTVRWLRAVACEPLDTDHVEIAVLPSFTSIRAAAEILSSTNVRYGAQDCFWEASGPFTGEVSPAELRELGCRYVEVGHAERRRIFGEDDETVARKADAAASHDMTPIVCVGETTECGPEKAAAFCITQLDPALSTLSNRDEPAPVIVAYEPVWAIGASAPAPVDYINAVSTILRTQLDAYDAESRLIYGGSAGPGLVAKLTGVDGLFLGRAAHDPARLVKTVAEVAAACL